MSADDMAGGGTVIYEGLVPGALAESHAEASRPLPSNRREKVRQQEQVTSADDDAEIAEIRARWDGWLD